MWSSYGSPCTLSAFRGCFSALHADPCDLVARSHIDGTSDEEEVDDQHGVGRVLDFPASRQATLTCGVEHLGEALGNGDVRPIQLGAQLVARIFGREILVDRILV